MLILLLTFFYFFFIITYEPIISQYKNFSYSSYLNSTIENYFLYYLFFTDLFILYTI